MVPHCMVYTLARHRPGSITAKGSAFRMSHEPPGRKGEINHSHAMHTIMRSSVAALAIRTYLSLLRIAASNLLMNEQLAGVRQSQQGVCLGQWLDGSRLH
jgi:hypothetical protein